MKQRILMAYTKDPEWSTCEVGWYKKRNYPEIVIPFFGRRIKVISAPAQEVEITMYIGRSSSHENKYFVTTTQGRVTFAAYEGELSRENPV